MLKNIANTRLEYDGNDNEPNTPRRHIFLETKPIVFSTAYCETDIVNDS